MSIKTLVDNLAKFNESLDDLKLAVYVGVPHDKNARNDGIGNAQLAYIHEIGSPARNIPARPFLVPGVEAVMDDIEKSLGDGLRAGKIKTGLSHAGIKAVSSVKKIIVSGKGFEPLSEATLEARRAKGFKGKKPLIRTGALMNSVTYVIK